jgi:hypothetical protein
MRRCPAKQGPPAPARTTSFRYLPTFASNPSRRQSFFARVFDFRSGSELQLALLIKTPTRPDKAWGRSGKSVVRSQSTVSSEPGADAASCPRGPFRLVRRRSWRYASRPGGFALLSALLDQQARPGVLQSDIRNPKSQIRSISVLVVFWPKTRDSAADEQATENGQPGSYERASQEVFAARSTGPNGTDRRSGGGCGPPKAGGGRIQRSRAG